MYITLPAKQCTITTHGVHLIEYGQVGNNYTFHHTIYLTIKVIKKVIWMFIRLWDIYNLCQKLLVHPPPFPVQCWIAQSIHGNLCSTLQFVSNIERWERDVGLANASEYQHFDTDCLNVIWSRNPTVRIITKMTGIFVGKRGVTAYQGTFLLCK